MKKFFLIILFMTSIILFNENIIVLSEENPFPECPQYEGDINKRGNVKNATVAFDLLLNREDRIKDGVVSTSFLKEKAKPVDYYAPWKANDNNVKTAWVEGKKGDGIGEKIYLNIIGRPADEFKAMKINFFIINGYAENEKLFLLNNRIKKAKLTIYEAKFDICGGNYSKRYSNLMLNSSNIIMLKDTMEGQLIPVEIKEIKSIKNNNNSSYSPYLFIAELEILEIYKGSKFDDSCISEFRVMNDI